MHELQIGAQHRLAHLVLLLLEGCRLKGDKMIVIPLRKYVRFGECLFKGFFRAFSPADMVLSHLRT